MKRGRRLIRALVFCGTLLLIGLLCWGWYLANRPQMCRLPDGSTLTLIGTTYGRQHRMVTRVHSDDFLTELRALFSNRTEISEMQTPDNALVLWVRRDHAKNDPYQFWFLTRLQVSDERGNTLITEAVQDTTTGLTPHSTGPLLPLILPIFPRQSKRLTVRFYRLHADYKRPDALFHVDNPAPIVTHIPDWTADRLPVTRTSDGVRATLEAVVPSLLHMRGKDMGNGGVAWGISSGPSEMADWFEPYGEAQKVEARFRIRGGSDPWGITAFWITDAMGNHWPVDVNSQLSIPLIVTEQPACIGYVAPDCASSLRYTIICNRGMTAHYTPHDLWTIGPFTMPGIGKQVSMGNIYRDGEVSVKLLGMVGNGATWLPLSPDTPMVPGPGVYIEVTGPCLPYLKVTDESGRHSLISSSWSPASWAEYKQQNGTLHLRDKAETPDVARILVYQFPWNGLPRKLRLTFAINKGRVFQFTVPPRAGLTAYQRTTRSSH